MRYLLTLMVLAVSGSAFAQSDDIFVDDQQQQTQQQQQQQQGGYPAGYPPAASCNPPCPAGHTCQQGVCQANAGVQVAVQPQPVQSVQPVQPVQQPVNDPRYARAAQRKGVIGFIGAALVLGLGSASAATTGGDDLVPSLPLGGATLIVHIVTGLIASGGGRAARRGGGRGIRALGVVGWVAWALAVAGGVGLVVLGASDADVPAAPIIGVTALGAVALISFGIDAVVGAGQARRANAEASLAPRFAPILYAAPNVDGGMTSMFGLGGAW